MNCPAGGSSCPTLTFDTNNTNHIATFGLQTVTYDAAGNLIQDGTGVGTHTYQYEAEGRLKSVDNGTTATYYYNALGQRVQKQPGSGLPADYRYYWYDAFGQSAVAEDEPRTGLAGARHKVRPRRKWEIRRH
jgi:YD repeat-containing protein